MVLNRYRNPFTRLVNDYKAHRSHCSCNQIEWKANQFEKEINQLEGRFISQQNTYGFQSVIELYAIAICDDEFCI
jgi:hypothetical protein